MQALAQVILLVKEENQKPSSNVFNQNRETIAVLDFLHHLYRTEMRDFIDSFFEFSGLSFQHLSSKYFKRSPEPVTHPLGLYCVMNGLEKANQIAQILYMRCGLQASPAILMLDEFGQKDSIEYRSIAEQQSNCNVVIIEPHLWNSMWRWKLSEVCLALNIRWIDMIINIDHDRRYG